LTKSGKKSAANSQTKAATDKLEGAYALDSPNDNRAYYRDFAAKRFDGNGFASLRQVIDVSGDGPNNQGRPVEPARDEVLAKGIVINGLPLMTREGMGSQWHLDDLDEYYRHCVIGGPGAFVIPVLEWSQFPQAVRRKLVLELAQQRQVPPARANLIRVGSPEYDCLIGEKIWDDIQGDWN